MKSTTVEAILGLNHENDWRLVRGGHEGVEARRSCSRAGQSLFTSEEPKVHYC